MGDHGPMGDGLGVQSIVGDAIDKTGIDDVGDEWFLQPLAAWSDDLRSDNLTDSGRAFLRRLAVNDVARRLEVLQALRDHPEIFDVPIPPIVYTSPVWNAAAPRSSTICSRSTPHCAPSCGGS